MSIPLEASDLAYWDIQCRAFVLEPGPIEIHVGSTSDLIYLKATVLVK